MADLPAAAVALDQVVQAVAEQRSAEVRIARGLLALAENYHLDVDCLVEALAEKSHFPGADGTPAVSEFLALELGPALGLSQGSAWNLVAAVLNLRYRHPLMWDAFCDGRLRRWEADQLTALCLQLSPEAAGWVDAQVAQSAGRLSFGRLKRLTVGWVAQADPALAAERERAGRLDRAVRIGGDVAGSTEIWARIATKDAIALNQTLSELVGLLGTHGDERPADERRAHALGLLAHPTAAQELLDTRTATSDSADAGSTPRRPRPRERSIVYVHLAAETLVDPRSGVARIEGHGPLTTESLRGTSVTIKPVIDPAFTAPVDSYEIPQRLREAVLLGTPMEAFPYSSRSARSLDLDHTIEYKFRAAWERHQTHIGGLGPLSRRVHRAKTAGTWRLRQHGRVIFDWVSPLGRSYTVGPLGTITRPASRAAPVELGTSTNVEAWQPKRSSAQLGSGCSAPATAH